eukprot:CAMPEP_0181365178 /NCGR_PEP_ID=MMETSP1106-20121128/9897_1 /TAXON_ID=81844 /ORGANISM="Mantoniella antarctica, Strain SL-175" /LENGTH=163 /DNA_ID=CAMNT_0023480173 /DNA_START=159 /DNA_END=645 /DNA_ORIENTATION=-
MKLKRVDAAATDETIEKVFEGHPKGALTVRVAHACSNLAECRLVATRRRASSQPSTSPSFTVRLPVAVMVASMPPPPSPPTAPASGAPVGVGGGREELAAVPSASVLAFANFAFAFSTFSFAFSSLPLQRSEMNLRLCTFISTFSPSPAASASVAAAAAAAAA